MTLTDTKIKNTKPKDKPFKLNDGQGLYLLINPNGSKWWRFRYTFSGKEKGISLGTYPDIALQAARDKRTEARRLVANNLDPSAVRKESRIEAVNTFRNVAAECYSKVSGAWVPGHKVIVTRTLEKDLYPFIGDQSINKIAPADILEALRKIESRGTSARRACQLCSAVFRHGIACGVSLSDPSSALISALRKKQVVHFPAITEPKAVSVLLRAVDSYSGTFVIQHALRLLPLLFVRPGELRNMEWNEVDLESAIWAIPSEKMKMRQAHLVPLSRQSIEILKELQEVTGAGKYVFPSHGSNDKPMSPNSFKRAFDTLGYTNTHVAHGFRAMARTLLDEVLQFPFHLIEHQLSHTVKDANGRAYNRTSHLPERQKMMQVWADYLFGLKAGARIIPFKRNGTDG